MEPSKVRIFYLRDKQRFPVACVASAIQVNKITGADGTEVTESKLHYGVSVHNPLDTYSKKSARKIAETRLTNPGHMDGEVECTDSKKAKYILLTAIKDNSKLPGRARLAAKLWVKAADTKAEIESVNIALRQHEQAS